MNPNAAGAVHLLTSILAVVREQLYAGLRACPQNVLWMSECPPWMKNTLELCVGVGVGGQSCTLSCG